MALASKRGSSCLISASLEREENPAKKQKTSFAIVNGKLTSLSQAAPEEKKEALFRPIQPPYRYVDDKIMRIKASGKVYSQIQLRENVLKDPKGMIVFDIDDSLIDRKKKRSSWCSYF